MDKASWVEAQQREFPKKFHGQNKLGLGPQQREFEEIQWTKQVGVGEKTGDNEFYPSLAFILIREFYKVDKRDNYRQC